MLLLRSFFISFPERKTLSTHLSRSCSPQDPEFQPDLVASKSYAAAGLCSWVLNIVKFYQVYCEVEPKRQALSKANAELAAAQEKLAAIKGKIHVRRLAGLKISHTKSLRVSCLRSELSLSSFYNRSIYLILYPV